MNRLVPLIAAVILAVATSAGASDKVDGYRGIWFTLGQKSAHGDKYSGGLGTYTANHVPIAIHSPQANKTFFVYGGTVRDKRHLLIMASYYDHDTGRVPRPTMVHDKQGVNDPHDNAAIALDDDGYVWVFVSGRARSRPGFIYRATRPHSVDDFEKVDEREMTYPQPRFVPGRGFFYLFTKYTKGRELYWQTSADGQAWEAEQKLAGFGGHYQVSGVSADGSTIGSAFMWHPGGKVDARTNLYYSQTRDFGKTWEALTSISPSPGTPGEGGGEGSRGSRSSTNYGTRAEPSPSPLPEYRERGRGGQRALEVPLASEKNEALLIDYQAQGLNVYIHDLNFDQHGRPAILYLTSKGHEPGSENGPRVWRVTRFDGRGWVTSDVCSSDHNYDTGSLFIDGDRWTVAGPTLPGPQPFGTGGEIVVWTSEDAGATWRQGRQITTGSRYNHSYVRRVIGGIEPFQMIWADGNPDGLSESRLYFGSFATGRYFELPYDMTNDVAEPIERTP